MTRRFAFPSNLPRRQLIAGCLCVTISLGFQLQARAESAESSEPQGSDTISESVEAGAATGTDGEVVSGSDTKEPAAL